MSSLDGRRSPLHVAGEVLSTSPSPLAGQGWQPSLAEREKLQESLGRKPLVTPESKSMHETSIYCKDRWEKPEMKGVGKALMALEGDTASQKWKYGNMEPNPLSARFSILLPCSPQHQKFCWQSRPTSAEQLPNARSGIRGDAPANVLADLPELSVPRTGSIGFDTRTLIEWFRELDTAESGVVTRRHFIAGLRQRPDYQALIVGKVDKRLSAGEESRRIIGILEAMEGDGHGDMQWQDFLSSFQRLGLVLANDSDREDRELTQTLAKTRASEFLATQMHGGTSKECLRPHHLVGPPTKEACPNRRGGSSFQQRSVCASEERDGIYGLATLEE
eukprot:CAMPEP_0179114210 /NCGR_PEP_ID=MMETSP0796-20121207/53467_1 /TAXON_ID=73915 /ORGANISM="Pyrodinium bahamense, Strain pbaha01" /LENGTH=332 /DNA_ID=CAMNT_0020812423 /DNA_START=30 /DNA_END=1028 /DNA_ORIENTATION=+